MPRLEYISNWETFFKFKFFIVDFTYKVHLQSILQAHRKKITFFFLSKEFTTEHLWKQTPKTELGLRWCKHRSISVALTHCGFPGKTKRSLTLQQRRPHRQCGGQYISVDTDQDRRTSKKVQTVTEAKNNHRLWNTIGHTHTHTHSDYMLICKHNQVTKWTWTQLLYLIKSLQKINFIAVENVAINVKAFENLQ